MTYSDLLLQKEWFEKCNDILKRDQYRCQKCGCLGYHNDSYYECETAEELESILRWFTVDGSSISDGIGSVINSLHTEKLINNDNEYLLTINNKHLYNIILLRPSDIFCPTAPILTATEKIISEKDIVGNPVWFNSNSIICPIRDRRTFKYGGYYVFNQTYFEKFIVRLERHITNYPICSIVICISYLNFCISLLFQDPNISENSTRETEPPFSPKGLNIHHKYYIKGKKPWEYDNDALITLCQDCHKLEHQTKQTPVYMNLHEKNIMGYAQICDRCDGSGYLPQYSHVEGGICFKCQGEGVCLM